MTRLAFVIILLFCAAESKIRFQSIGVKGTLLCGEAPTPGIRVRLWDNDMGELVDSPKQSSFTDFDGKFEFDDWTPYNDEVDPLIRIAHDCNDGVKPGQRLFKFKIPKSYVVEGKEVPHEKFFNLGTINLEFKPFNEERYNKGDISKRGIIRTYAHKLRVRRHENVVNETSKTDTPAADSTEDDPCDFGLCTFSGDRKRRSLEETSKSDEIVAKEESQEDEGCASEGACPIHLTRKRRAHRRAIKRQSNVEEKIKSDEIITKDEDADSGCSDGACPIDLSRKKRDEEPDVECGEVDCPLHIETTKKNATTPKPKFGGRDESPEDRIDPW